MEPLSQLMPLNFWQELLEIVVGQILAPHITLLTGKCHLLTLGILVTRLVNFVAIKNI